FVTRPGRDADSILRAAAAGEIALVVAGVDPTDFPDPALAFEALSNALFIISLELRESAVTDRADVVFPVARTGEKAGTYLDWEGRARPFEVTLQPADGSHTGALSDLRVLDWIAEAMGVQLGTPTVRAVQAEIQRLGAFIGTRPEPPAVSPATPAVPDAGQAILAGWRLLLDEGRLQDGEPHLAGTRKPSLARLSETTAKEIGADPGGTVTIRTDRGEVSLPIEI